MKFLANCICVFICFSLFIALDAEAESDARSIMEQVDARDDGDNQTADLEMVLIDQKGNERTRTIKLFSKDKFAYTYLPDSVSDFPYGEAFELKLEQAGFEIIFSRRFTFGISSVYHAKK